MKSDEIIIDRGRGPEIKGTRITVYTIIDYLLCGWHPERIAGFLRVSSHEVQAAIEYIDEHKIEVLASYLKGLELAARGNPPEVQARLDAGHGRFQEFLAQVRNLRETDPELRRQKVQEMVRQYREQGRQGSADAGNNGRQ